MGLRWCALLLLALACARATKAPIDADTSPDARPAPEAAHIAQVVVTSRIWPKLAGAMPDEAALGDQISDMFASSEPFSLREGSRPAIAVIAYGLDISEDKDKLALQVAIMAKVRWEHDGDDPILFANGLFEATVVATAAGSDRKVLSVKVREHLDHAFRDTFSMLVEQNKLRIGDVKAVLSALEHPEPHRQIMALRYVEERKLHEALSKVISLLESRTTDVRDAAIGALVSMREQSAVPALTRLVRFRDIDLMRRVLDAVGSIGGSEARAYLEFVIESHDNQTIQKIAREALERLNRKE